MRSLGWQYPFVSRSWSDTLQFISSVYSSESEGAHLLRICQSVIDCHKTQELGVTTSMHDLVVTLLPASSPPLDVVIVRAPSSLYPARPGNVRVETQTVMGRNDQIDRPTEEAVPLFWRFMGEIFGVDSGFMEGTS